MFAICLSCPGYTLNPTRANSRYWHLCHTKNQVSITRQNAMLISIHPYPERYDPNPISSISHLIFPNVSTIYTNEKQRHLRLRPSRLTLEKDGFPMLAVRTLFIRTRL